MRRVTNLQRVALGIAVLAFIALAGTAAAWCFYAAVISLTTVSCLRGRFSVAYAAIGIVAPLFAAGQILTALEAPPAITVPVFTLGYLGLFTAAGTVVVSRVRRIEPEALLESLGLSIVGAMVLGAVSDRAIAASLTVSLVSMLAGFLLLLAVALAAIGRESSYEMRLWSLAAPLALLAEVVDLSFDRAGNGYYLVLSALGFLPILAASRLPNRGAFLKPSNVPLRRDFGARQVIVVLMWLAVPPLLLAYEARNGLTTRFVVDLVGALLAAIIAGLRVRLLVSLRDWSFSKEAELRLLGAKLVEASNGDEARDVVFRAMNKLAGDATEIAILGATTGVVLCSSDPDAIGPPEIKLADDANQHGWWKSRHATAKTVGILPITVDRDIIEYLAVASSAPHREETRQILESASSLYSLALLGHQRQEESHQRRSEQRFRGLAQDSNDVVFVVDGESGLVSMVGPTVERLLGYSNEDFREIAGVGIVHPADQAHAAKMLEQAENPAADITPVDLRIRRASGLFWWFLVSARNLVDDPEIGGIVISMTDIHTRKLAELQTGRSESLYRTLVSQTSDVFVVADESLVLTYATPNIESVLGYAAPELFGTDALTLLTERSQRKLEGFLAKHDEDLRGKAIELEATTKWGNPKVVEVAFCDPDQTLGQGYIVRVRDLSERQELKARFQRNVGFDALTSLPMRDATYDGIAERLQALKPGEELSVMAIDASGSFSVSGGALGLEHGDALMLDMVERVSDLVRDTDLVSRIDGYEIAIVSVGASGDRATFLWARLQQLLSAPFSIRGSERRVKLSVGCYQTDQRSESPIEALEAAHIALGFARKERGSSMVVFKPEMRERLAEQLELEEAMQSAVDLNEFYVVYQPLIRLDNMRVKSLEALLRWKHPGRGLVSPADFIPIAEESGMITELGRFVLRESCRTVREWNESLHGGEELAVSVNLSVRQLQEPGEVARLLQIIEESGVRPSNLMIELTESILVEDPAWLRSKLSPFQQLGAQIAVDDFGTGAAGLNQLREVRFDYLKIDKTYIDRLGISDEGTQLVLGVIELGHRVGAAIVAEGIENPVQVQLLREMNCEVGQGFFFAKPMAPERFPDWLGDGDNGAVTMGIDHHSLYSDVEVSP